jgi:hypothetical protein
MFSDGGTRPQGVWYASNYNSDACTVDLEFGTAGVAKGSRSFRQKIRLWIA